MKFVLIFVLLCCGEIGFGANLLPDTTSSSVFTLDDIQQFLSEFIEMILEIMEKHKISTKEMKNLKGYVKLDADHKFQSQVDAKRTMLESTISAKVCLLSDEKTIDGALLSLREFAESISDIIEQFKKSALTSSVFKEIINTQLGTEQKHLELLKTAIATKYDEADIYWLLYALFQEIYYQVLVMVNCWIVPDADYCRELAMQFQDN